MTNSKNYKQQKADFLDSLQPDDFRNAGSFNQAELIIEQLEEEFLRSKKNNKNSEEFIKKALTHLFREGSLALPRAIEFFKEVS